MPAASVVPVSALGPKDRWNAVRATPEQRFQESRLVPASENDYVGVSKRSTDAAVEDDPVLPDPEVRAGNDLPLEADLVGMELVRSIRVPLPQEYDAKVDARGERVEEGDPIGRRYLCE